VFCAVKANPVQYGKTDTIVAIYITVSFRGSFRCWNLDMVMVWGQIW